MSTPPPPSYSSSPLWANISPIPLSDAPDLPGTSLAAINYPEHYAEAMSYLRAVMAANEVSERALQLTQDIIASNPAHYTVWLYRAKIVRELGEEDGLEERLKRELEWVEAVAGESLKNYQIWHHRQMIMSQLSAPLPTETAFMDRILAFDVKNYHVWTYRTWLIRHFGLWDSPEEFESVQAWLTKDVRNNSAWTYRWFLCFGREEQPKTTSSTDDPKIIDLDIIDREIAFAQSKIKLAPQNSSPWSYLRALVQKSSSVGHKTISDFQPFAEQYIGTPSPAIGVNLPREGVKSTFALDWVAECYAEQGKKREARELWLGSLAEKWDPIRKGYWEYRANQLLTEVSS